MLYKPCITLATTLMQRMLGRRQLCKAVPPQNKKPAPRRAGVMRAAGDRAAAAPAQSRPRPRPAPLAARAPLARHLCPWPARRCRSRRRCCCCHRCQPAARCRPGPPAQGAESWLGVVYQGLGTTSQVHLCRPGLLSNRHLRRVLEEEERLERSHTLELWTTHQTSTCLRC